MDWPQSEENRRFFELEPCGLATCLQTILPHKGGQRLLVLKIFSDAVLAGVRFFNSGDTLHSKVPQILMRNHLSKEVIGRRLAGNG